jgi:hypothetical protein
VTSQTTRSVLVDMMSWSEGPGSGIEREQAGLNEKSADFGASSAVPAADPSVGALSRVVGSLDITGQDSLE